MKLKSEFKKIMAKHGVSKKETELLWKLYSIN